MHYVFPDPCTVAMPDYMCRALGYMYMYYKKMVECTNRIYCLFRPFNKNYPYQTFLPLLLTLLVIFINLDTFSHLHLSQRKQLLKEFVE